MDDETKSDSRPYGRGVEGFSADEIDDACRWIEERARRKQAERRQADATRQDAADSPVNPRNVDDSADPATS